MKLSDFDFHLAEELIAFYPSQKRDQSKLLVVNRQTQSHQDKIFSDLPNFFGPDDLLVINASKVILARLPLPENREIFLAEKLADNLWNCLVRKGKYFKIGKKIIWPDGSKAEVVDKNDSGLSTIKFYPKNSFDEFLEKNGEIPLPPYIKRKTEKEDKARYQTVYAHEEGSLAAPTAGLHFTPELLNKIRYQGSEILEITLHVGLGTFLPVKTDIIEEHQMHAEHFYISPEVAGKIMTAKKAGKKITAVGTTSMRAIESAFVNGQIKSGQQSTDIFIYPPHNFQVIDQLLTNFHLPKSTLLMLLSAFASPNSEAGLNLVKKVYDHAMQNKYRFFSYGDASLWL